MHVCVQYHTYLFTHELSYVKTCLVPKYRTVLSSFGICMLHCISGLGKMVSSLVSILSSRQFGHWI